MPQRKAMKNKNKSSLCSCRPGASHFLLKSMRYGFWGWVFLALTCALVTPWWHHSILAGACHLGSRDPIWYGVEVLTSVSRTFFTVSCSANCVTGWVLIPHSLGQIWNSIYPQCWNMSVLDRSQNKFRYLQSREVARSKGSWSGCLGCANRGRICE